MNQHDIEKVADRIVNDWLARQEERIGKGEPIEDKSTYLDTGKIMNVACSMCGAVPSAETFSKLVFQINITMLKSLTAGDSYPLVKNYAAVSNALSMLDVLAARHKTILEEARKEFSTRSAAYWVAWHASKAVYSEKIIELVDGIRVEIEAAGTMEPVKNAIVRLSDRIDSRVTSSKNTRSSVEFVDEIGAACCVELKRELRRLIGEIVI